MSNTTEAEIRADERREVAGLLRDHAETFTDFAGDKAALVGLIAYMLELPA